MELGFFGGGLVVSSSLLTWIFFNPAFLAPPTALIASIKSARPGIGGDGIEDSKFIGGGGAGGGLLTASMLLGGAIGTRETTGSIGFSVD